MTNTPKTKGKTGAERAAFAAAQKRKANHSIPNTEKMTRQRARSNALKRLAHLKPTPAERARQVMAARKQSAKAQRAHAVKEAAE